MITASFDATARRRLRTLDRMLADLEQLRLQDELELPDDLHTEVVAYAKGPRPDPAGGRFPDSRAGPEWSEADREAARGASRAGLIKV